MFADLCYFSVRSVQVRNYFCYISHIIMLLSYFFKLFSSCGLSVDQISGVYMQLTFAFLVLPCLLLGYLGQAAYLMENHADAGRVFYSSVPSKC